MFATVRRVAPATTKFVRRYSTTATETGPQKKTQLYDLHKSLGAKFVPFAGWEMPVQYPEGVLKEHLHCRSVSSLFDVSHMVQLKFHGKDRVAFLEKLVVGDIAGLAPNHSRLSVFTNEKGGIIDDTVITNAGDHLYVVVNAGCAEKDIAHLNKHMKDFKSQGKDVSMEIFSEGNSLIAVQGPQTEKIMQQFVKEDLSKMDFMTQRTFTVNGIPCVVTRCGYTGEDGFEISVPDNKAVALATTFLDTGKKGNILEAIKATGLGARDSLRLEAGLCLYGHDLSEDITPVEATLGWLIGKRRREQGGFPGADVILQQLKEGVTRKRVGILVRGAPAREEATVLNADGEEIGKVTSGSFSPVLQQAIAMGYVKTEYSKPAASVVVKVRGKDQPANIARLPFVPTHYKKTEEKK